MFQLCLSRYVLITLCILVLSFEFDLVWSTCDSSVFLSMPCPALMFIKDYHLSLRPRLRVLVPPSCVHRDRRPDLTVSGAPSPCIVFRFSKVFCFVLVFCLSLCKEVAARHPALARGWCVGVRRDRRECRESSGRELCSVCRLGLSQVSCPCFMSLLVKYVPAVFVSLCVNYPVYISPVFWVWFGLVYLWLPGVSVHVSHALSCLDVH